MERIPQRDQPPEGTAKPTKKAGPKPWEVKQYLFTESRDNHGPSHCDPRLELAQQSYSLHQDRDFIPSDGDSGYGHPAFGIGVTSDLNASASTASELETLAGGGCFSKPKIDRKTIEQHLRDHDRASKNMSAAVRASNIEDARRTYSRMEKLAPR
jgi:hypothetical protein